MSEHRKSVEPNDVTNIIKTSLIVISNGYNSSRLLFISKAHRIEANRPGGGPQKGFNVIHAVMPRPVNTPLQVSGKLTTFYSIVRSPK